MDERIPMPTSEEKRESIDRVLDTLYVRRAPLWRDLWELLFSLGPSGLFFGMWDCLFLALLILALVLFPVVFAAGRMSWLIAPALFILSPLLYASLLLLTQWKERQSGTIEWAATFRISFRVVSALRMLALGGASVLVCVPLNVLLWRMSGEAVPLGWMLALSLSSLFAYGALSLFLQRLPGLWGPACAPCVWATLGLALWPLTKNGVWITAVPTAAFAAAAALSLWLYTLELRRYCRRKTEGGKTHALG